MVGRGKVATSRLGRSDHLGVEVLRVTTPTASPGLRQSVTAGGGGGDVCGAEVLPKYKVPSVADDAEGVLGVDHDDEITLWCP
jgi:hypothetical protein